MKKETSILLFIVMLVFILVSMTWNISFRSGTKAQEDKILLEKELDIKYQEGIEVGRNEIYDEIAKDINTWKGYRLPVKIQDGTNTVDTFMILIPPSMCPR